MICCDSENRSDRDFDPLTACLEKYHGVTESASVDTLLCHGTGGLCPGETWDRGRHQVVHLETQACCRLWYSRAIVSVVAVLRCFGVRLYVSSFAASILPSLSLVLETAIVWEQGILTHLPTTHRLALLRVERPST